MHQSAQMHAKAIADNILLAVDESYIGTGSFEISEMDSRVVAQQCRSEGGEGVTDLSRQALVSLCRPAQPGRSCTHLPCPWCPCPPQPCGQCPSGTACSPAPALLWAACRSLPDVWDTQTACTHKHPFKHPFKRFISCIRGKSGFSGCVYGCSVD